MKYAHESMWTTLMVLTTCFFFLPQRAGSAGDLPSAVGTIKLRYEHQLLSAEIAHAPLAQVLATLRQHTGVQVRPIGAFSTDCPISVTVHDVPLDHGIRRILKDVSYALQAHDDGWTVHVLPGPEPATYTPPPGAQHAVVGDQGTTYALLPPKAFPPRAVNDPPSNAVEPDENTEEGAHTPQAQQREEVLLTQALDTLHSAQAHLYAEALDQLAYSSDARAIEALTQTALGNVGVTPKVRGHAVTALSRHALQRASSDPLLVTVLEQLAASRDEPVRAIARQALEDIQQRQQ